MPQLNRQVGQPLLTQRAPKFDGFVVVGGTWKPKDLLKDDPAMNEDEEIFNHSFYGPGTTVDCEMYQLAGSNAVLAKSMVITELATDDNPNPGSWLVMKAEATIFSKRAQKFSVTLERHDAEDMTQQTPA